MGDVRLLPRISSLKPLPDYRLAVGFDDGKRVVYDVSEDMDLPGYERLRTVTGLFQSVQLDQSRTCVYWNEDIDLPSDIIYEYGTDLAEVEKTIVRAGREEYEKGGFIPLSSL